MATRKKETPTQPSLRVIEITLPTHTDPFGRWLEDNGGRLEIGSSLGEWDVALTWGKTLSYSDDTGHHRVRRTLHRHGKDLSALLDELWRVARELSL